MILFLVKTLGRRLTIIFLLFTTGTLGAASSGPTLLLDYGHGKPLDNSVSKFMYFVPLISPDPVSVFTNAGNTQCARVLSFDCRTNGSEFSVTCEFEFNGKGFEQNVFDHTQKIALHKKELEAGDILKHQLGSINVTGDGNGSIEIEGTFTNGQRRINEVQLRFNRRGHASPVTINLMDIGSSNGTVRLENEMVARVNALTFGRTTNAPKMEVSLASIKRKDAGNGAWQNFWGGLKGVTANFFLPPIAIEAEGQQAMLDFGLALATEKPAFTFPSATRLTNTALAAP